MRKPFVSVILTVKNGGHVIDRCLRSVIQQKYPRFELIVVDNHSTDATRSIAERYTKNVFTAGPERSAQRNFGAQHAKGDFFFFIDGDMELDPMVLEGCVHTCATGHGAVMVAEHFVGIGFWSKCKALEKNCYTGTGDGEAARFYRRDVFFKTGGYDEALTGPEDIDMHKRAMKITSVGRASGITHYDEHLRFVDLIRKRYFYSLSLQRYLSKHTEAKKEFRFFRAAFLKNFPTLLGDPFHFMGFLVLRFFEALAVIAALLRTRNSHHFLKTS